MTALALKRGHTLTFFNRGKTKTDRYPEIERIKGDRNGEIDGLKDREWDVVIDNSGYVPRHVRLSAELLAPKVKQYVFVSSISVYPNFSVPRDESSPVGKLPDETVEKVDGETYGPLKALCEQAVEKALPGRTTIIRPGLIVGPDDNTDRFTYWPARAARGGEFIAPGAPSDPFQVIDVRDLAAFTINAIENMSTGTYNLVSNVNEFKFGALTDACVAAARKQAKPADGAARYLSTGGVPRGTEGGAVERNARVAARQGRRGRLRRHQQQGSAREGTQDHADSQDRGRHARLASDAAGRRAREAQGRHRARERSRRARGVEGQEGLMAEDPPSSNRVASIQKWILRVVGVAGVALFAFFFALTFYTPQWVERFAADFIESRVAEKVYTGIYGLRGQRAATAQFPGLRKSYIGRMKSASNMSRRT